VKDPHNPTFKDLLERLRELSTAKHCIHICSLLYYQFIIVTICSGLIQNKTWAESGGMYVLMSSQALPPTRGYMACTRVCDIPTQEYHTYSYPGISHTTPGVYWSW
jgi:hypothetical protein